MIALDTNVLVRLLLVDDDQAQSDRAAALVLDARERGEPILNTTISLVESVWLWHRRFKLPKGVVLRFLAMLLSVEGFVLAEAEVVGGAIADWQKGNGDFADYLIRAQARASGASRVATFDQALLVEPDFMTP